MNIYAEASGRDIDSIKTLVDKETWFTGQEAVDAGFADRTVRERSARVHEPDSRP